LAGSQVFSHDKWDEKSLGIYPFKQRIDELCKGHGVTHMSKEETDALFRQYAKHHQDIIDLQTKGAIPNDNYLVQFTSFALHSNLTTEQKYKVYRKSYEIYLEELEKGNHWNDTLSVLIGKTSALTKGELQRHLQSNDKWIKRASEKALKNHSLRGKRKNRGNVPVPAGGTIDDDASSYQSSKITSNLSPTVWVYGLSGLFLLAGITLVIRGALKKQKPKL